MVEVVNVPPLEAACPMAFRFTTLKLVVEGTAMMTNALNPFASVL